MAKDMEPIIAAITEWATEHPQLTAAIIAGTVAFFGFLTALTLVGIIVAAVGATVGAAMLGIAAVIAVVAALVISNWNSLWSITETVWNVISFFFTAFWNGLKILFTDQLDEVKESWQSTWTDMSTIVQNIWATIQSIVKTGVNDVISAINGFINALDSLHITLPSIGIPGTKLATPAINLGFNIPDIPMLAEGGFVTQPTLAIIGESGPEAVIPLSAGGGMGGGQQINVYIQGGIFPADASSIKQIGDMLAKQILQTVRVRNYQP